MPGLCHQHLRESRSRPQLPRQRAKTPTSTQAIISQLIDIHPDWITGQDDAGALHAVLQRKPIPKDVLKFLLERSPNAAALCVSKSPNDGHFPLQCAIHARAEDDVLEMLLSAEPKAASVPGLECALLAIDCGYTMRIVRRLLDCSREAVQKALIRRNYIHNYVEQSYASISMLRLLLDIDQGALTRKRVTTGEVPMHHACRGGPAAIIGYLSDINASSLALKDAQGELPIFQFIRHCGIRAIDEARLIYDSISVAAPETLSALDRYGKTLLHVACHGDTPKFLVEEFLALQEAKGKDVHRDARGQTALHMAISAKVCRYSTVHMLVSSSLGPDILEADDNDGRSPLHALLLAPGWSDDETVQLAICMIDKNPAILKSVDRSSMKSLPLHYAAESGLESIVRHMLQRGEEVFGEYCGCLQVDSAGRTPLHRAAAADQAGTVRLLVELCPTAASIRSGRRLPIHGVSSSAIKRILFSAYCADRTAVEQCRSEDFSPVRLGLEDMFERWPEMIKNLDENGTSGLDYAIMVGCREDFIGEVLRRYPSLARRRESQPFGPAHLAASIRNANTKGILQAILGSIPSALDDVSQTHDRTVLHEAVISRQPIEVIDFLLGHSQWQAQRVDRAGLSAAHYAWKNGDEQVLLHLLRVSARSVALLRKLPLELLRTSLKTRCALGFRVMHTMAARTDCSHIIRLVAAYRPDLLHIRDSNNLSPIEIARSLENFGALAAMTADHRL